MHLGCMTTLAIGSKDGGGGAGGGACPPPPAARRTTTSGERLSIVSSSSRAELVLQRELTDSFAGRGKDRVGQRGRGDRGPRFADPAGLLSRSHEVHFDGGRLVDAQHANVMEVRLLDPAVLER